MARDVIFPPSLANAVKASGLSPAVRAGDLVFLTGATGAAPDGTMPDDTAQQTEAALDKIATICWAAGASLADIVEVTTYHTDLETQFDTVEAIFHRRLGEPLPAWTAVEIASLRRPGAHIEIRTVLYSVDP